MKQPIISSVVTIIVIVFSFYMFIKAWISYAHRFLKGLSTLFLLVLVSLLLCITLFAPLAELTIFRGREKQLGPVHIDTMSTVQELAALLQAFEGA